MGDDSEDNQTSSEKTYWGGRTKDEYYGGLEGILGFMAAISLVEGNFDGAIMLLEENNEIPPVFLHTILLLLKGEATHPETSDKFGFQVKRLGNKTGAPDKSEYLTTGMQKAEIGYQMFVRHKRDGEKYEMAAEDVALSNSVSVRTVTTAYSWFDKIMSEHLGPKKMTEFTASPFTIKELNQDID